jgi:hypothetical protein
MNIWDRLRNYLGLASNYLPENQKQIESILNNN